MDVYHVNVRYAGLGSALMPCHIVYQDRRFVTRHGIARARYSTVSGVELALKSEQQQREERRVQDKDGSSDGSVYIKGRHLIAAPEHGQMSIRHI